MESSPASVEMQLGSSGCREGSGGVLWCFWVFKVLFRSGVLWVESAMPGMWPKQGFALLPLDLPGPPCTPILIPPPHNTSTGAAEDP